MNVENSTSHVRKITDKKKSIKADRQDSNGNAGELLKLHNEYLKYRVC